MNKENIQIYAAAVGGAFLLVVADLMSNVDAATTLKLGSMIENYFTGQIAIGKGMIGLFLVLAISAFFCWIYHPNDRVEAFTRGLSVFAVLNVVSPYSAIEGTATPGQSVESSVVSPLDRKTDSSFGSFISAAYAASDDHSKTCRTGPLIPNATLAVEREISSCKPHYAGFLGLSSFFNNTIERCNTNYFIPAGERVKYLETWQTGMRGYNYTLIEYAKDGTTCTGWVSDGRKSVRAVIQD